MSLLTLKEASEQLHVSKITICNWVKEKKIDFIVLPNGVRRYKIESITSGVEEIKKKKDGKELFMPEYQQESNSTTSSDKSISLEKNIQTIKLSETSEAESITKRKDLEPWWNSYCKEISQKLWLPTKTDCVDSDSNSSSSYSKNTIRSSLFSTTRNIPEKKNSFKTSFPSLQSSPAGLMVLENTGKESKKSLKHKKKKNYKRKKKEVEGLHRTVSFRLYPSKEQRNILRRWFGTARYCYNQVIGMFKENNKISLTSKSRNSIMGDILKKIPFDHNDINLEVKRNSIQTAFNTIISGGDNFKFRTKKSNSESIYVRKCCISTIKNTIFPKTFTGKIFKQKLIAPELDGSLLIRKGNNYFLNIIKVTNPELCFKEGDYKNSLCALDLGTHTFLDYYSPSECGKIGVEAGVKVFSLCRRIDRLISLSSGLDSHRRYKLNKVISREREKLKNKVKDLHWKTASFLCKRYDHIFLSHFETKEMAKKDRRKISSKTVRKMLTLSHYLFSQRLISKAEETGTVIYKLHEPYTSKLCGNCFELNNGLKLKERTYSCKHCHIEIDRDYNGARNILLRGLNLLKKQGTISLRWEAPPS